MLLWIPLNERVGFGTISNIVIIAAFIQIGTIIFPKQRQLSQSELSLISLELHWSDWALPSTSPVA
jgi:uncharacterized protein